MGSGLAGKTSSLAIFVLTLTLAATSFAQTSQVKIGSLDLAIGGIQAAVSPAQPVIPKNIASGVEVVVTQNGQQLTPSQIAQYLGGSFQLVGEYSGPGLTQTVDVPQTASAANSLILDLPAVNTSGNYTLSNVRFVVNGNSVLNVSPSTIPIDVIDQVLVTSVQTKPLTLDEIQAAGVVLDSSAYTGFQFTIGLQLSSQVVNVSFPVVFNARGVAVPQPLMPPTLPPPAGVNVPMPTIVPVLLQGTDGGGNPVALPDLGNGQGTVKIPSVLVIPGNVGYLKQFFSAQLYVSNGAPGGSNLTVENVTGTITLPSAADGNPADNPLALPNLVSGAQPVTMNVLAPGPGGTPSVAALNPGDTGQAQWTIRGDKEGYYTINFGINATLQGLPTGPITLAGAAIGGVLVRNPYFNMTFAVPGVVRKDELFNLYATITNTSQVAANNLTVNFDQGALSGVTLVSPPSSVIPTLNAGDSTTLTFQFRSLQTGRAVASYLNFDTNNGTTGSLNFTLGVYANGTPMSPDTLALPSAVDNLPSDVVDAAMRVLGQAWSVATAPANTLPAGVISTTRNVVTQKALLLAEAGLRQSLGEPLPNALRDLGVDFFNGSPVDPGFDQVLRTTPAGQNFVSVLGANLADPMNQAGGVLNYESQLANILSSGQSFITFAIGSGTSPAPVSISFSDGAGNQVTSGAPGGSMIGAALFPLGTAPNAPYLGLLTAPANSSYTLLLTGQSSGNLDIAISIPRGDGTVIRGTASGIIVVAGQQMRVPVNFSNPNNLVLQVDSAGDGSFATAIPLSTQNISPAGPTLISATVIGSETVSQANNFGLDSVLLFDRVVDPTTAGKVSNYQIPNNSVLSASKQLSGRLVFANLAQPEGPYVPTTFSVNGIADQQGAIGPSATVNLQSRLQDPGAVVSGRVLGADGTPSTTAIVTYVNTQSDPACTMDGTALVGLSTVAVGSSGAYEFRYVHQDQCGGPFQISTKDPNTGTLRKVSNYVRARGQQLVMDLALLGLGSVSGTVTDLSGKPVYNAQVAAISGTDPQTGGTAFTDANGNYSIGGVTVGPVTVKAMKGTSLGSAAGNIFRAGTSATVNVTLSSGAVNVSGTVTTVQGGVPTPLPGAPVVYYLTFPGKDPLAVGVATTATNGNYSIQNVPPGTYAITAYLNTQLSATQSGVAAAGDNLTVPLQVVIPTTGTVNGKVTFPNGTPAAGAVVYQGTSGVLSNSDGTFSLSVPVLPSQSQTIYARSTDGLRSGYASVVVNSAATPVTGANITLSGLGSAQFTVLDASGKAVASQQVIMPDSSPGCNGVSQTTNGNGIALFSGLGIGSVRAVALRSVGSSSDLASATASITQDGTTGFATMQFKGSGTVTGSVVDPKGNPVFGAVVLLSSNTVDKNTCNIVQMLTQSAQTDTSGNFRFTGVNVGNVGVTASQSFFPTQVGAQGVLSSNGATVNFPLQLVNTISGVLSGTIFLPDGVTPAGAGVQVTANGPLPNVTVDTDASGNFRFAKIFPESLYTLTASDPVSGGVNQIQIYLRAGQDMTQNLRLKGAGTINVRVVDGAGVPVSSAFVTLTETDYPNASFTGSLDASNQGVLSFPNVFEGGFSVKATDPFARGGRASGILPQGTSRLNVQVQLTTTGTVQGHFLMPDGVTPIPNGSIQLTANGQSIGQATSLDTGDVGSYSFEYVPAGPIQLKAQDPLTGRTGIAAGTITAEGQVLSLDVKAQGLDTIQGLVTENGAPEPGASVMVVSGNFQATTTADANGFYLINGVPEGVIVATASLSNGYLSGTASSTIGGDGKTLTLDVALHNSGTITGQVLAVDGVTPAPPSSVTISIGGSGGGTATTTTDGQGNFSFQNIPAGSGTISVQVLGGIDRGTASVDVPAGGTTSVPIKLNGTGAIAGTALDSAGNPVSGTIVLTGTGPFPYYLTLTAATDGTFALPQVLAGPFTAKLSASIGGFTLYGTTTSSVTANQTTTFTVQVQPSGTVTANVLRPDGQTPAIGASVRLQLTSGGSITLQVQNDGTFTASGVPLGTFNLQINDSSTGGIAAFEGLSVASNGQNVNLGTITLDGNALSVISSNPSDGQTGIGINQALTVTFSEALTGTTGISVTNAASNVYMNASLSADGKTVTLQGTMPDGVPLVLNVTGQVTDVFGRQLAQPQQIHFTTTDLSPPYVISVSPANQAIQVPVTTTISVTFNKALSTTAPPGNVVSLSSTAGPVAGSTTLSAPNVLTFTPTAALANNSAYMVTVNGAVSFGGNVQTAAFTSSFVSPETIPPVLQLNSPASGSYTNNSKPTISISLSDSLSGINPASAILTLDGQAVSPAVGTNYISFTPSIALSDGSHSIAASVRNNAGIQGSLSGSFIVDTVPPSAATLSGVSAGQVLKGQIAISASATDSVSGIARINLLVDGSLHASLFGPSFSTNFNTATLADGLHNFAVQAINNAGSSGPVSAPVQAYVENVPLTITISSPQSGASFGNQVQVSATTSKPVTQIAFTLLTQTITVTSTPYQTIFNLASISEGQQTITATATYIDGATVSTSVTIIVDHTPPPVKPVLIAANPPVNGLSLVRGLPSAIQPGSQISITNLTHPASAVTTAGSDGSFSTNTAGSIGDVLSLIATDAAGNSSTPITFAIPQTAPLPQVAQVQPADGSTGVPLNSHIVVRFTQPVAATSIVPGTLRVLQGGTNVGGTVTLSNDSLSLTLAPSQNLSASTTYSVVVQDVANNQNGSLFQSGFTTGTTTAVTAPQIVQASPQNGATGVPINAAVHVLFTEAMDPATLTTQNFIVSDQTTSQTVPGMIQVDATGASASFVPQPPYGIGRTIAVQLTSNIKDSFGNALTGGGTNFSFSTGFGLDNQGPSLVGTSPADTATGVPLNALVVAEFDSPLDVVNATSGFQVWLGTSPISGGIALSDSNKRITFTPLGGLAANSIYTIVVLPGITDIAGNAILNAGTFTFTTGPTTDTSRPQVTGSSPVNAAAGVPTNTVVQLQFSKRIDPYTVNGSTFYIYPTDTGMPVPASITVSADGLTATLTPANALQTGTTYQVIANNGITDLEGQAISYYEPYFTTGLGTSASGPTVVSISPVNGAAGVPVNGRVDVLMSAPVSAASVVNSTVALSAGGAPVTGSLSVSGDRMTVTFVPSSLLTVSTTYTVTVSGITDQAGNVMVPMTSSFTTNSSSTTDSTRPSVSTVSPSNGATAVNVNSTIVLTFNEAIDPTTVNNGTIPIAVSGYSGVLAGSYTVSGAVVTFTPLTALPGNATVQVNVNYNAVADLSGNLSNSYYSTFTTSATTDSTAPQVVMVTPQNGASSIGLNAAVILTFSKSLNPNTINTNNFGLLANGSKLGISLSHSADNRVVSLSAGTLPATSVVTVVATTGVTDLAGNALGNFQSSFTTGAADTTHPTVVSQRPGNGATAVPLNTSVVLYLNEVMNASTLQGALHISQNGVLVSGTVQVTDNGQAVQFTPSAPWQNGAFIQVFMDGTAQDADGNSLNSYQGSFTTMADTSMVAPVAVNVSPANTVSGVGTNAVVAVGFSQMLSAATVNNSTVYLTPGYYGAAIASSVSLLPNGTVVQLIPSAPLSANTQYYLHVTNGLLGTNGLAFAGGAWWFQTGAGADTLLPAILSVSPPNGSTNVGDNVQVHVVFNKPINPLTVNASSIQLAGGGTTQVADAISFSNNNQSVMLVPHGPLPDNTVMTLTISGVTDVVGNAVVAQTTQFTTGAGPDLTSPAVVQENPFNGETAVPLNGAIQLLASEPVDPGTVNSSTLQVIDNTTGQQVAGTYSVSADGRTISFVPSTSLAVSRLFYVYFSSRGITDLAGNQLGCTGLCNYNFTTGTASDSSGPQVVGVSPANGQSGVPINAQVVIQFNEPIDGATLGQVSLSGGNGAINVSERLSNANQTLTLIPILPLATNTTYTVTVAGVQDIGGNPLQAPVTTTFVTSAGVDLTPPQVTGSSPVNAAAGVPTNTVVQLQFSKRIDPYTVNGSTFYIYPTDTGMPVPTSITVSADGLTATLTPASALQTGTTYQVIANNGITDLEGQAISYYEPYFTTGLGTSASGPTVVSISPVNGAAGVPVNGRVDVLMSAPVSAASVVNGTVALSAGGAPVTGSLSVSGDRMTVTFVPSSLLTVSTTYTVTVMGITDQAGNVMVPMTSSFTTSSSSTTDSTRPSVSTVSPSNGATAVNVNSTIVLTFNEAIDPTTVNNGTIPIAVSGYSGVLAGSYTVSGAVVTFTPLTALPGNATVQVNVNYNAVADLSGNLSNSYYSTFTTSATTDSTAPQVVMVTPQNGASSIGLNAAVTLTFSKSLNPNTINTNNFGLLANGSKLGISLSHSADNRVVSLSAGTLPATSVVTVVATTGVTDLAGNALGNFQSSFTTGAADTTHPAVVSQRPGNGATAVPLNTSVVLYLNEVMNASTLQGALHISQNGVLVSGTVQVTDNGQAVQFTPSAPWQNGAFIQVFMDGTAQDADGNSLNSYQGSFTTMADTSMVAPVAVNVSPANTVSGVGTNAVVAVGFSQMLSAATVNNSTVYLTPGYYGAAIASSVSLLPNGTVVQLIPSAPLSANTQYYLHVTNGLLGTNGLAFAGGAWWFQTGAGADTLLPAILSVSPPNGSTNVGDNVQVHVVFNKPINPLTVNASSIQLAGGGTTQVADAISFSNNNQSVMLVPHGPLPDNTVMTLTISGVTDVVGNAVVAQTTQFTTGAGPDLTSPAVVQENPFNGETAVPLNGAIQLLASEPVDPGTVNSSTLQVIDNTTGQQVAGTYSVSADGRTISFVPSTSLAVSRLFYVYFSSRGITDLAGNQLGCTGLCNYNFTTGTASDSSGPQVVGVSPANGQSGVPINAQVVIQFNEPIDGATLGQVSLSGGNGAINVSERLSNANQTLTLIPILPLATNTTYTVTVAGVQDIGGNPLQAPVTTTFVTSAGVQLAPPFVMSVSPGSGASNVPTNTSIQLLFSSTIDPLTVASSTFKVYPSSTGTPVSGTISVSPEGTVATFTPAPALASSTNFTINATSGIADLDGLNLSSIYSSFTTGTGPSLYANPPARPQGAVIDWSNPLSTDLAGLFPMNEGSGTTDQNLVDSSPSALSGVNPPRWNSLDPSLMFLGGGSLNSYLNAGTDLIFDQLTIGQMTVVAKVYVNSISNAGVCEKNDNNSRDSGFVFGWDSTGAMRLTIEKSSGDMRVATPAGIIPVGQWVQVAFTWDGTVGSSSSAHLFIAGAEQSKATATDGSGTIGYTNATNQPFRIGNADFDFAGSLYGKIAYLAVYKGRILTPAEMNFLDAQLPIH